MEGNVRSEIEYYPSIFQVGKKKTPWKSVDISDVPVENKTELHPRPTSSYYILAGCDHVQVRYTQPPSSGGILR